MKWMTEKEAKAAARKSKRAAIASCKKHWRQNYTATEEEMQAFYENPIAPHPLGISVCALCHRYQKGECKKCPLGIANINLDCGKEYKAACFAFRNWRRKIGRFSTWQKKAKLMYERICEL